jgi:hypothetical protein
MLLPTRNRNIYGSIALEVGVSVDFDILQHFLFKGDGSTIM